MEKVICLHIDWLLRLAVRSVQASSRNVPIRFCLSHVGWLTAAGQAKAHGQWPLEAHRARLARDVVGDRRGCLDSSKFLTGLGTAAHAQLQITTGIPHDAAQQI